MNCLALSRRTHQKSSPVHTKEIPSARRRGLFRSPEPSHPCTGNLVPSPSCPQLHLLSRFLVCWGLPHAQDNPSLPRHPCGTHGWEVEWLLSTHKLPLRCFTQNPPGPRDRVFQQSKQTTTHTCTAIILRKSLTRGLGRKVQSVCSPYGREGLRVSPQNSCDQDKPGDVH